MRDRCQEAGVAFFHKQSAAYKTEMGIELDGQVIRVFDKHVHQMVEPEESSFDRRWVKIRPPLVVVGGELTIESLDLTATGSARSTRSTATRLFHCSVCNVITAEDIPRRNVRGLERVVVVVSVIEPDFGILVEKDYSRNLEGLEYVAATPFPIGPVARQSPSAFVHFLDQFLHVHDRTPLPLTRRFRSLCPMAGDEKEPLNIG